MKSNFAKAVLITGHYGSGKTNLAVNLALDYRAGGEDVALCDLDIVNPYFRSSDFAQLADERGIELIAPPFAGSNLDMPTITGRLDAVLRQPGRRVVVDVGGDDAGAIALGRYARTLKEAGYEMLYVINASRPVIAHPADAVELLREIEGASRLSATAVVNNTHMCGYTDAASVEASAPYAQEVARLTGLPLAFTAARRDLTAHLSTPGDVYPVDIYVKLPWDR